MNKLLLSIFFCGLCFCTSAATDTTWLNNKWKPCTRAAASYYLVSALQQSLYKQTMYIAATNRLYMRGTSIDKGGNIRSGIYTWYNDNGNLVDSFVYSNNVPVSQISFHPNGQKKTVLLHDKDYHATYVQSWDRNGSESLADTFYYSFNGHSCHRDTAKLKGIISKEGKLWNLRFYNMENGSITMNGHFKERLCKTRTGATVAYNKDGSRDSLFFDGKGKREKGFFFHPNGIMSAEETYDDAGAITKAKYWDEAGNRFKPLHDDRHPRPLGYLATWRQDFNQKVNNNPLISPQARKPMIGSTVLDVLISPEGKLVDAHIVEPSPFAAMDSVIAQAFRQYSLWTPPILHGRQVTYRERIRFTFIEGRLKENNL